MRAAPTRRNADAARTSSQECRRSFVCRTCRAARPRQQPPHVPFAYKLVLNQWLLPLFNVKRFEDLAEHLRNEALEGLDENNIHHFHHALTAQLFNLAQLPTEQGRAPVRLQFFIVSNTPSHTMTMLWNMEKSESQKRHVLFQEEDRDSYVRSMLEAAGAGSGSR